MRTGAARRGAMACAAGAAARGNVLSHLLAMQLARAAEGGVGPAATVRLRAAAGAAAAK